MEKVLIIGAEVCAVLLSILCVYHYFTGNCDSSVVVFSIVFAIMAAWCHKIQKDIEFDFRLW